MPITYVRSFSPVTLFEVDKLDEAVALTEVSTLQ